VQVNIKGMANFFSSKFAKSVVKLTSGMACALANDEFKTAGANLSASGSRITDAESAREIIALTKAKILSRADISVSGQANQSHRDIIELIQ
jgi:flagellin-like hook-associated protein FlgL